MGKDKLELKKNKPNFDSKDGTLNGNEKIDEIIGKIFVIAKDYDVEINVSWTLNQGDYCVQC